jgi:hypothetical protein
MSNISEDKKLELTIEVWKKVVEVQEHFNTIEMQIRNLAVTVLTTTIGAATFFYKESQSTVTQNITSSCIQSIQLFGLTFSSADLMIFAGLIAWIAFYFMDRWWYHRLLKGAVDHAKLIEDQLKVDIPNIALSNKITSVSPLVFWILRINSNTKIDIFYGSVVIILIMIMAFVF